MTTHFWLLYVLQLELICFRLSVSLHSDVVCFLLFVAQCRETELFTLSIFGCYLTIYGNIYIAEILPAWAYIYGQGCRPELQGIFLGCIIDNQSVPWFILVQRKLLDLIWCKQKICYLASREKHDYIVPCI